MENGALGAWEFERGVDPGLAARVARDGGHEPDLTVIPVFSGGDELTVRVVRGAQTDPQALLYVAGYGVFEVTRVEEWPPAEGTHRPRVLLTLRACSFETTL